MKLPDPSALASLLERGLLRGLKGKKPFSEDEQMTWSPALAEAARAQPQGGMILDLIVHQRLLPGRLQRAMDAEQRPLQLADGSTLEVAHAHKRLVEKEPRAPFVALRNLLEARAEEDPPERLGRRWLELRAQVDPLARPEAMDAFHAETRALLPPLLDVLSSQAGHAADDGHRLHRALDPAHPSFTLRSTREALTEMKEVTAPRATRPARRVRAPAALAGASLLDPDGPRLLATDTWRALGFIDQMSAAATTLITSIAPAPAHHEEEETWRALGEAAGLAQWSHPGLSRMEREKMDRLLRAVWGVRLLLRIELLNSWASEGAQPEAWTEALMQQLGGCCDWILREGWRVGQAGSLWPRGPGQQLAQDIRRSLRAVRLHAALRDRYDERWPCAAELVAALHGAQRPAVVLNSLVGDEAETDVPCNSSLIGWLAEVI